MKVAVYRNLRAEDDITWSIRSMDRSSHFKPFYGRVIAHATHVVLSGCNFVVGESGRQKVRDTKQKNVHAYIQGKLEEAYITKDRLGLISQVKITSGKEGFTLKELDKASRVYYNPYKHDQFSTEEGSHLFEADKVWLRTSGEVYAII